MSCGLPRPRWRSTFPTTPAGTWWTGPRWPWSSHAAEGPQGSTGSAVRRLQAAQISVLVGPGPDGGVAEVVERRTEHVGLVAAQLEQQRPAWTQEVGCAGDDAAQDVGAVRATVVMRGILEPERVAG